MCPADDRSEQEGRKTPRFDLITLVWYKVIDAPGAEGVARTCDASSDGLGIYTTTALPEGAYLFIELTTRFGNLSAVGKVIHNSVLRESYYRVGVHLEIMPPHDRQIMEEKVLR